MKKYRVHPLNPAHLEGYHFAGRRYRFQRNIFRVVKDWFHFVIMEEAVAGAADIDNNYAEHQHSARELAEEFLGSARVLNGMLQACGV